MKQEVKIDKNMLTMPLLTKENIVDQVQAMFNQYPQPLNLMRFGEPIEKVQVRFPKSKRKRIRKKWAKNPKNWQALPNYYGKRFDLLHSASMNIPLPKFNDYEPTTYFKVGTRIRRPEDSFFIIPDT